MKKSIILEEEDKEESAMTEKKNMEMNKKMYQAYVDIRKENPVKKIDFVMPSEKDKANK